MIEKILQTIGFSFAHCNVCGNISKIRIRTDNLREDGICKKCRSNSRKRHLSEVLLKEIQKKGSAFSSLKGINNQLNINLYNVESNGALHNNLRHLRSYTCSEYFGPYETHGTKVNGVLNVNLMETPFRSNTFDYVISTEVFEHIPDPYKAFNEVYRVSKVGGSHIFTVPYYSNAEMDEVRSIVNENNEIVHLMEPQYHGDPIRSDEGILVYTIFEKEMLAKLEDIGFKVQVNKSRNFRNGILGDNNIVFITTKN